APVDQAELEQTLAWCYRGAGDHAEAVRCFENAIKFAPGRTVNYVHLADLFQSAGKAEQAQAVMGRLVRTNKGSAEAYTARAHFRLGTGRLDEAAADLARPPPPAPPP